MTRIDCWWLKVCMNPLMLFLRDWFWWYIQGPWQWVRGHSIYCGSWLAAWLQASSITSFSHCCFFGSSLAPEGGGLSLPSHFIHQDIPMHFTKGNGACSCPSLILYFHEVVKACEMTSTTRCHHKTATRLVILIILISAWASAFTSPIHEQRWSFMY